MNSINEKCGEGWIGKTNPQTYLSVGVFAGRASYTESIRLRKQLEETTMFAPMSPMTERVRNQNEQPVAEYRSDAPLLPRMNVMALLRKVADVRRPEPQRQTRLTMGTCATEHA
jgi:hypothetical protein